MEREERKAVSPANAPSLVIVVGQGPRMRSIRGWLRQLMPAALLVVSSANLPQPTPPDVIVLDDSYVPSGPLSLADALLRQRSATTESAAAGRQD